MKIDFAKLQYQYQLYKKDIGQNIQTVLNKSNYIMGEEVTQLEDELQNFTQAKHVISCSSGTDALLLAMMAMDIQPDDEIITTPFTFIATAETIALMKAKPVFVDVDPVSYNINPNLIEAAITDKTKAIMPVGLYGQPSDMDEINAIAKKHKLKVIIDGAQSFGATYQGKQEVHHCDIYTTSFFPAKPLGCYGDGGAVFTNNAEYAEKIKMMRVHGQNKRYHHKYIGMGGRLDTMQAAVLLAKLPHYADEIEGRQAVAQKYNLLLKSQVTTPQVNSDRTSVWAQYTICVENREDLQVKLKDAGIPTAIHYPMPLHLQECFQYLKLKEGTFPIAEQASKEVMSLPMNPFLSDNEIEYVTQSINNSRCVDA
jgi:UDP-2-acetamido-2-deoxy-ribo-hexuluronate aminotransferase